MRVTFHAWQRVQERIPGVHPKKLAQRLAEALAGETKFATYEGRLNRGRARLFRFQSPEGKDFMAVVDTNRGHLITVYDPETENAE